VLLIVSSTQYHTHRIPSYETKNLKEKEGKIRVQSNYQADKMKNSIENRKSTLS
jgi:hypothetical protein